MVGVNVVCNNIYIFVIYIPPTLNLSVFEELFSLLNEIEELHPKKVICLGDFNTPLFANGRINNFTTVLNNFTYFHNFVLDFVQHNVIYNAYCRMLDLVFSKMECEVSECDVCCRRISSTPIEY